MPVGNAISRAYGGVLNFSQETRKDHLNSTAYWTIAQS
jgi:hypothetical protein